MAGLFGNRFDTMSALDDALYKESLQVGQLSSYGVGQMAAYQDGKMGNPFAAAVNDLMSPEMQKQNILDELQKKHPSPDTPEELTALADDLMANGFGDMAQTVRLEATEMRKVAATAAANTLRANTPTDSAFDRLSKGLSNRVITKEIVHKFMQDSWNNEDGSKYGKKGEKFTWTETDDGKRQYDFDYDQALKQLQGEIQNYAIHYQAQNPTKAALNKLLGNPSMQIKNLKTYIEDFGRTKTARYLSGENIFIETPSTESRIISEDAYENLDQEVIDLLTINR